MMNEAIQIFMFWPIVGFALWVIITACAAFVNWDASHFTGDSLWALRIILLISLFVAVGDALQAL